MNYELFVYELYFQPICACFIAFNDCKVSLFISISFLIIARSRFNFLISCVIALSFLFLVAYHRLRQKLKMELLRVVIKIWNLHECSDRKGNNWKANANRPNMWIFSNWLIDWIQSCSGTRLNFTCLHISNHGFFRFIVNSRIL